MVAATAGEFERTEGMDLLRLRAADMRVGVGAPAPGAAGNAGREPLTVGLARERLLAAGIAPYALLDGAMFGLCAAGTYATTTCARLQYRAVDRGNRVDIAPTGRNASLGGAVSVVGTRAAVGDGASEAPGAQVVVQGFPLLVKDRVPVASRAVNRDVTWRAALAVLGPEELAFAVWSGTMADFAEKLARVGAQFAIYSDGGGSARLMNGAGVWKGSRENRRVASVWYAAPSGAAGAPDPSGIDVRDAASGRPVDPRASAPGPLEPEGRVVGLSTTGKIVAATLGAFGLVLGGKYVMDRRAKDVVDPR